MHMALGCEIEILNLKLIFHKMLREVNTLINPFSTKVSHLYPLKTSENWRLEVGHWLKMG